MFITLVCIAISVFAAVRVFKGDIVIAPIFIVSMNAVVAGLAWKDIYYSPYALKWSGMGALTYGRENLLYSFSFVVLYFTAYSAAIYLPAQVARQTPPLSSVLKIMIARLSQRSLLNVAMVLAILAIVQFLISDKDVLWYNTTYLALADSASHGITNPLGRFLFSFSKLLGIGASAVFAIAFSRRYKLVTIVSLVPFSWYMLFEIAGHSRYATVYAGTVAVIFLAAKSRRLIPLTIFFFIMSLLNMINALSGRANGMHGFLSLPYYFVYAETVFSANYSFLFGNLFEGAFVQGEVFRYIGVYEHAPIYKILSFSPFPSFIDSFSTIARHLHKSLSSVVPMGATGEILLFGKGYIAFYYLILFSSYFTVVRYLRQKVSFFGLLLFFIFMLGSYLQFAYPVRSVLRMLYIPIFFVAFRPVFSTIGMYMFRLPSRVRI